MDELRFPKKLERVFTQIPVVVVLDNRLTPQAFRLYALLRMFEFKRGDSCFPGQERLGELLGLSRFSVSKYMKELETYGLIRVIRRGLNKTNVYFVDDADDVYEGDDGWDLVDKWLKPAKNKDVADPQHPDVADPQQQDVADPQHKEDEDKKDEDEEDEESAQAPHTGEDALEVWEKLAEESNKITSGRRKRRGPRIHTKYGAEKKGLAVRGNKKVKTRKSLARQVEESHESNKQGTLGDWEDVGSDFEESAKFCAKRISYPPSKGGKRKPVRDWHSRDLSRYYGLMVARIFGREMPRLLAKDHKLARLLIEWKKTPERAKSYLDYVFENFETLREHFGIKGALTLGVAWGYRDSFDEFQKGKAKHSRTHRTDNNGSKGEPGSWN